MSPRGLQIALSMVLLVSASASSGANSNESDSARSLDLGEGAKLELVLIPAGEFEMGSPESESEREKYETPHAVKISKPFYMGKYEVTNAQFWRFRPEHDSGVKLNGDNQPAVRVSWYDAQAFSQWLSKKSGQVVRLATEAEWEYACRAGTKTRFSSGDKINGHMDSPDLPKVGWYGGNSGGASHVIGSLQPNAFGLYDMHGNAWEWCFDWFDPDYYRNSPTNDPQGPDTGVARVLRGGCYYYWTTFYCRSAHRYSFRPDSHEAVIGFRVVVESQPDTDRKPFEVAIPEEKQTKVDPLYFATADPEEAEIARKYGRPATIVNKPSRAPIIDGKLDDACWNEAHALPLRFLNGRSGKPSQATTFRILADERNLYAYFDCAESNMKDLRIEGKDRPDDLWMGDSVELFLDPSHEGKTDKYFHIGLNPDGTWMSSKDRDPAWKPKLTVAASKSQQGWCVELSLPLSDLNIAEGAIPTVWRINATRFRPDIAAGKPRLGQLVPHDWPVDRPDLLRLAEDTAWAPTHSDSNHIPLHFGHAKLVVGKVETPLPEKAFELIAREDFSSGTLGKFSAGELVDGGYMGLGKALHIKDKEVTVWQIPVSKVGDASVILALKTTPGSQIYWHTFGKIAGSNKLCPGQVDTLTRDPIPLSPLFSYNDGAGRIDATSNGIADPYYAGFMKHLLWCSEPTIGRIIAAGPNHFAIVHTQLSSMTTQHPDNKPIDQQNEETRGIFIHNADGTDVYIAQAVLFRGVDNEPPEKVSGVTCKIEGKDAVLHWKPSADNTLTVWYRISIQGADGKPGETVAEVPELYFRAPMERVRGKKLVVTAVDYFENFSEPSDAVDVQQ